MESETATFDLSLLIVEEANSLKGTIEYNTDLFNEGTISRMIGHLQTLLEHIVSRSRNSGFAVGPIDRFRAGAIAGRLE